VPASDDGTRGVVMGRRRVRAKRGKSGMDGAAAALARRQAAPAALPRENGQARIATTGEDKSAPSARGGLVCPVARQAAEGDGDGL
jgi:hypothetical protein